MPPVTPRPLNQQQRRFAIEYSIDGNITQAAIRAGYKEKGAHAQGSRLLKDVRVMEIVEQCYKVLEEECQVKGEKVIQELQLIGFSNVMDYWNFEKSTPKIDMTNMTRKQAAAISRLKVKQGQYGPEIDLQFHSKPQALEKLGKVAGLFEDKVTHEHSGGVTIQVVTGIPGEPGCNVSDDDKDDDDDDD